MAEYVGWIIVVGVAIAVAGIYLLSNQIERHVRETTQSILDSNEMVIAQLQLLAPSARVPESLVGMILERRCNQRRSRLATNGMRAHTEHRASRGRRASDILAAAG